MILILILSIIVTSIVFVANIWGIIDTHIAIRDIPKGVSKFTIEDARKFLGIEG